MSTPFTALDRATGEIQFTGTADDTNAIEGGHWIWLGHPTPGADYLAADGSWANKPPKPGRFMEWDWASKTWVDPRTLAQAKANRVSVMKVARDNAIFGGVTWDGDVFDSDERSQSVLLGLFVDARNAEFVTQPYRLANNGWRVLEEADMLSLWQAVKAHIRDQFTKFAMREAAINSTTSSAAAEAVTWD